MYNMHKTINEFYENHVRLKDERKKLAEYRDINLDRLRTGLESLEYPKFYKYVNQGSYAMSTINQHPNKDYDIDVGIIFRKDDLPSTALDARKRVEDAMREGGGNFSQPPEAKTNAVRVYYTEGHHIDLAIYRTHVDIGGNEVCEHSGSDWTPRDPMDITNWFNTKVVDRSPSNPQATVAEHQLRRVVRWLKVFAKSRETWDLPGGLILSVLTEECYQADNDRDDVSLLNTMNAVLQRLKISEDVYNPIDRSRLLTNRPIDQGRICRLRDKLGIAIDKLQVLHDDKCTEGNALTAWYWVFQHDFWNSDEASESITNTGKRFGQAAINGSIYVSQLGQVSTTEPPYPAVHVQPQRFFGEK